MPHRQSPWGFPLYSEIFTVLHNYPAPPQDHFTLHNDSASPQDHYTVNDPASTQDHYTMTLHLHRIISQWPCITTGSFHNDPASPQDHYTMTLHHHRIITQWPCITTMPMAQAKNGDARRGRAKVKNAVVGVAWK